MDDVTRAEAAIYEAACALADARERGFGDDIPDFDVELYEDRLYDLDVTPPITEGELDAAIGLLALCRGKNPEIARQPS